MQTLFQSREKIGNRIAALVAFAVFSSMVLLSLFLALLQVKESVNERKSELESTAYIFASALAESIENQNRVETQHVLSSISRVPAVLHAVAVNTDGKIIAAMGNVAFLEADQVTGQPGLFEMLTKGNLPVVVDIVRGGKTAGKLVILGDISKIRSQLLWTLLTTALAALVASLLAFPLSLPLRKRIAVPITKLTDAMKLMRETRSFRQTTIDDAEGETRVLVDTFNSMIGDIHRRDESLRRLAYFDPLTGLPNRVHFQRLLQTSFEKEDHAAAVFLFDIDHFHAINDAMGHSIGDALLMDVAARLHHELPEGCEMARLGGDEFATYIPGVKTVSEAHDVLAKLIASLYAPIKILGYEIHVTASVGVVMVPLHATSHSDVQRHLDLAMHDAKRSGVGRISFFRSELVNALTEESEIVQGLRKALVKNEITAHFQPIVNLKTGMVDGFEALARWNDVEKGMIPPSKFIPAAEKSGLISKIGMHILRLSCQQAKRWKDEGKPDWTVAVNVSAAQILQAGYVEQVREILLETGLPPHLLCLELTESLFVGKSMFVVQKMLEEFKSIGILTALDDFGTGYSSLSYLEHLPFDKLKIDRAFVHGAKLGSKSTELLKGIVSLAHGLHMTVVAEGAETAEEVALLRKMSADSVQGFAFAHPMPAEDAARAADQINAKSKIATKHTA